MDRDDIIRMAREAGLVLCGDGLFDAKPEELERFAVLVAAAEREACARVCEGRANGYKYGTDLYAHEHISEAHYCAAAIRARGEE